MFIAQGRSCVFACQHERDLARQEAIVAIAKAAGYYVAAVYREKASGTRQDRPELLRMNEDLQSGEIVVSEKIDCISHLPLPETERLVETIRAKVRGLPCLES